MSDSDRPQDPTQETGNKTPEERHKETPQEVQEQPLSQEIAESRADVSTEAAKNVIDPKRMYRGAVDWIINKDIADLMFASEKDRTSAIARFLETCHRIYSCRTDKPLKLNEAAEAKFEGIKREVGIPYIDKILEMHAEVQTMMEVIVTSIEERGFEPLVDFKFKPYGLSLELADKLHEICKKMVHNYDTGLKEDIQKMPQPGSEDQRHINSLVPLMGTTVKTKEIHPKIKEGLGVPPESILGEAEGDEQMCLNLLLKVREALNDEKVNFDSITESDPDRAKAMEEVFEMIEVELQKAVKALENAISEGKYQPINEEKIAKITTILIYLINTALMYMRNYSAQLQTSYQIYLMDEGKIPMTGDNPEDRKSDIESTISAINRNLAALRIFNQIANLLKRIKGTA